MNGREVIPFGEVLAKACRVIVVCNNPYHKHKSPMQEMIAVEYCGHDVAITRDGDSYSVRLDRDPLTDKHGLTVEETIAYVERNVQMEVIDVR
jgi:hypothetical protein